jgi:hypothetical protein
MRTDDIAAKDSQMAIFALVTMVRGLAAEERAMAEVVIGEWLLSTEETNRFGALAVTNELGMRSAIPKLRLLESQLVTKQDPGAPFELKKVRRILAKLEP